MDLFNSSPITEILPYDGSVIYHGIIFKKQEADQYFHALMNNIEWKHDEAIIFGKRILTKRKVAWYGNAGFSYTYSNITRHAIPWTKELLELKAIAEEKSDSTYNSCLMNLYHNGDEGVSWHSDDEATLAKYAPIASISFGASRKFAFKHKKNDDNASVILEHGSLLIMKDATQENWLHAIPKSKKVMGPRISLTFRTIVGQ